MNKPLMSVPGRDQKITLFAKVFEPRVLQWSDPYKPKDPPQNFPPLVTNEGGYVYTVPFAYAERLLRGEPEKYFLVEPKSVIIKAFDPMGANRLKTLNRVVPYIVDGKPQFDENGVLKMFSEEDLPDDADVKEKVE